MTSLHKEATGFTGSLGLPAREAVTEGDWRVVIPDKPFAKAGTKAQPLSPGCAEPAPLTQGSHEVPG